MATRFSPPARALISRARSPWLADVVVGAGVVGILVVIVHAGHGATVSFTPTDLTHVDTNPSRLPYDAARTLLRMFVALAASYVFALGYGYVAARSRRAEKVLIPALDILQSVPVLGFLSITVTGFIALFPGSELGLECAAVFAIFTSQAWNLAFSFYQSLIAVPRELDEVSRMLRLTRWLRFWRLDVPGAAIPLVWNGMMSMGGGWFFLVASEAISVGNLQHSLPGVGSYAAAAIDQGDLAKVGLAIATMAVVVVGVNALFWSPLVAWAERFKLEQAEAVETPRSAVLDLLRRSHWPVAAGRAWRPFAALLAPIGRLSGIDHTPVVIDSRRRRAGDAVFWTVIAVSAGLGGWRLLSYLTEAEGWAVFWPPLWQGLVTLGRVAVLMAVSTVVWVPLGVLIGLSPRLTRRLQPVVQVVASFPANFLFPVVVVVLLRTNISLDLGGIVLMALGAQWYVLFNAIAGTQAIPTDLRDAMDDLGVHGRQRWRRFYLPAVLPAYVTGAIAAAGGAWNASIVAEVVTYGSTTLTATGLGAYIALATATGDQRHVLAGVVVMSLYVVAFNRLFWRRLYRRAARFSF